MNGIAELHGRLDRARATLQRVGADAAAVISTNAMLPRMRKFRAEVVAELIEYGFGEYEAELLVRDHADPRSYSLLWPSDDWSVGACADLIARIGGF